MAQKFVVAMMMHETNTFSPLPTPIESFARSGALNGPAAIKETEGTNTSLGGQLGHRDQDPLIKSNDSDFPEPGNNEEHSGEKKSA